MQKSSGFYCFFFNTEASENGTAVLVRKGILRYKFTIHGKAVHSSICTKGANAIAEAAYKIIELEKMKDVDGLTCNCGIVQGGTVPNTVAEICSFSADIRFSTAEELANARTICKQISESTNVADCFCTLEEISYRPPMESSDRNYKLLEEVNKIYSEIGLTTLKAEKPLADRMRHI